MSNSVTILDGGMSRELMRLGAPFRQPEWSALALIEDPAKVGEVHHAFIEAGADVITTNSYAIVPFHIGDDRFREQGRELAALAGQLARAAADGASRPVRVAGSLPPLFGSYRPDLFDASRAPAILGPLIEGLRPSVDIWLAETQSSLAEVRMARQVLGDDPRPLWLSFTLDDDAAFIAGSHQPTLRSGESLTDAVATARAINASALLFNCSQAEIMEAAVRTVSSLDPHLPIGIYANAFVPSPRTGAANSGLSEIRDDLTPASYRSFAEDWVAAGASIVGGCCGIGSSHIAELARALKTSA